MTHQPSPRCSRAVRIVVCVVTVGMACVPRADARADTLPYGAIRIQGDARRPDLIFGCDRQTSDLDALFTPDLISQLRTLGAGVALSTEDLSPARARVVRRLMDAGIPMLAWIVLPKSQGYYVNAGNTAETAARFSEFDAWTTENDLRWQAVGLDIEPTLQDTAGRGGN